MSLLTPADALRQLAHLAGIRGTDPADLRDAVQVLDRLSPAETGTLLENARAGQFPALHTFSPDVARAIRHIALAGGEGAVAAVHARLPWVLRRLLEIGTITHAQACGLVRDLGIVTLVDLQTAVEDGRTAQLPDGIGERLAESVRLLGAESRSYTLGRAWEILDTVKTIIETSCRAVDAITIAGDARRCEPLVEHLALVVRTADAGSCLDSLSAAPGVEDVLHRSGRRGIISHQQAEVDVRFAAADDFGTVLFGATGSPGHVRGVATRRRPGLCAREADVYSHAGVPWIPPEMRNANGEIELAASGRLPRLVDRADIRGDLHMHSTYSDGQDTVEAMVSAARELGYEYVAITDHSENAAASRTVTIDQLARQREEIERLRERFPRPAILHGIEVDILPDGTLDFSDAVLEQLDIVLASLHDAAGQDGAALTRRCIRAIQHPLVNVITHPSNQLVGRRGAYPMDYAAIYDAAAETGTALEVDGAPSHLDLDGDRARAAVQAGVTVVIDSDCHRARALDRQMQFGLGTARRGWVEPRHVLNTRPLAEVRAFIERKRAGRIHG